MVDLARDAAHAVDGGHHDLSPAFGHPDPAFGALLAWLLKPMRPPRNLFNLVIPAGLLAVVLSILPEALAGEEMTFTIGELGSGLSFALALTPLGMIYALVAASLWILNTIYSYGYMHGLFGKDFEGQERYWCAFAMAILSAMGIAFSANMLTLFLFYEVMTFSTWPLVTHTRKPEAKRSGRIYLGILVGSSTLFMLTATVLTWVWTGTLDFKDENPQRLDHRGQRRADSALLLRHR